MNEASQLLISLLREALEPLMHEPPDPGHDIHDQEAEATWLAERERLECEDAALRVIAEALEGEVPTQEELAWWLAPPSDAEAGPFAPWRQEEAARLAALLGDRQEPVIVRTEPLETRKLDPVPVQWSWGVSKSLLGQGAQGAVAELRDPAGWELRASPQFPDGVLTPDDSWLPIMPRSLTLTERPGGVSGGCWGCAQGGQGSTEAAGGGTGEGVAGEAPAT